ncbi:CorA family divalent cation transporter, partial [Neisseria sp. P0015.S010]
VYDHNMQLIESLDASRDMVLSMMDIYLSFQSNRMNQQMRVLTVITIIFMPLTVITGIYGMNFDNMPELHWHYGYFMVLGVMLCIIIGLLIFFSRRKWL